MNREELKRLWWSIPHGNQGIPTRTIVVTMDKYKGRIGQGTVQITRDDSDGYSCFSTHQVKPVEWALNKMKDKCQNRLEYNINYDYSKYKLVIN
tara:strand:+ start:261 stop:542 length:282 start_codon:yes stop_codon:yes gene_type:complete